MRLKKILRNVNLLNIVLIATGFLFAGYWLSPLLAAKIRYVLPGVKKPVELSSEEKPSQAQAPSVTEYSVIAEENLFHPERKIPPDKKADEAPMPKPDFVLYGTLVSDDLSLAYIEDLKAPRTTPGRGKRSTALRKGDKMSGFTLKEIETDKVVMARGGEQVVVPMVDPSHPKTRDGQTTEVAQSSQPAAGNAPGRIPAAASHRLPATGTEGPARMQRPAIPTSSTALSGTASHSAQGGVSSAGQNFLDLLRRGRN
jgi:type II secretory pathway component PulC